MLIREEGHDRIAFSFFLVRQTRENYIAYYETNDYDFKGGIYMLCYVMVMAVGLLFVAGLAWNLLNLTADHDYNDMHELYEDMRERVVNTLKEEQRLD